MTLLITALLMFLTLASCGGAFMLLSRRLKQTESRINEHEKSLKMIETELKALLSADIVFGESVTSLKEQLVALDNRQVTLENQRGNDGGYAHALKLLQMGSNIEDIKSSCNLSSAEADLLMNLHAYRSLATDKSV